jgi:hypothetical protein
MKFYRGQIIVFVFAALCWLSLDGAAQVPKAHRHSGAMPSMLKEIAPEFSAVETTLEKNVKKENAVINKNRTFEAFTVSGTRIFVKNLKTGKIFELKGLPLEWRDFSDLAFSGNQTLLFDRWAQPHYGTHYAVDVVRKKLTEAAPFSDESRPKQKGGAK